MRLIAGWVVLVALVLAGCEPKERDAIVKDGGKALEHAGRAVSTAWNSVAKKVSEISPESSKEAMDNARLAVVDLQKQAAAIENPTPEVLRQVEQARAALAKIDAAARLRELQEQAAALAEQAKQQTEVGAKKLADVQEQMKSARETYDAASSELEKLSGR